MGIQPARRIVRELHPSFRIPAPLFFRATEVGSCFRAEYGRPKEKPQNTLRGWPLAGQSKRHTIRFDHAAPQNDLGLIVSCARSDCHIRRLNSNPGHFGLSRGFRILRCNHIAQVTPSAPPAPTHGTAGQPASTTQTTLATSAAAIAKGVAAAHRY